MMRRMLSVVIQPDLCVGGLCVGGLCVGGLCVGGLCVGGLVENRSLVDKAGLSVCTFVKLN